MGVSTAPEQRRCGSSRGGGWAPLDVEAAAPATSVAVMAPALTESGPQKPNNLLPPLPAGGFLSAEQAAQVIQNEITILRFLKPKVRHGKNKIKQRTSVKTALLDCFCLLFM